jgi:hypothetical protein
MSFYDTIEEKKEKRREETLKIEEKKCFSSHIYRDADYDLCNDVSEKIEYVVYHKINILWVIGRNEFWTQEKGILDGKTFSSKEEAENFLKDLKQ